MPYIFNSSARGCVAVVYPVVEGTHQQEAKSAGKKASCCLSTNRLMMGICRLHISEAIRDMPIISKVCTTFPAIILAFFHYLSGKSSQHHGSPESEAAPDPGVVVVSREAPTAVFIPEYSVAEMPQYQPVHLRQSFLPE